MTERYCPGCQCVLVRHKGEWPAKFNVREYCSRACYLKYATKATRPATQARRKAIPGRNALKAKSWTVAQNHKLAKRLARLPRKDFETVDSALARGVPITRCEPAYAYPSDHMPNGSPVRPMAAKGRRAS